MDERLNNAPFKACLYLFLGALAIRLLYLSQYATTPFFWVPQLDPLYHDLLAQAIATGKSRPEAFFRAPGYYHFLAGVYWLFGHSYWAARIMQAVIGSLSCVLLYLLGARLFRPAVGLVAAAGMALYGPLVYADGELHTPVLEVFLTLGFLLLTAETVRTGSRWTALAAGMALGLSAITRPNVLVLTPLALFWLWGWWEKRDPAAGAPRMAVLALFLAGTLTAPGLVTLRNYRVSGDPVFIASQGGINLFLGNRPEADGFTPSTPRRYRFDGPYEDSVALYGQRAAEEALGRPLKPSEVNAYWVGRAVEWWRAEPGAALALTSKKWTLAWGAREVRNNTAFDFVRQELAPALWFCPVGFWLAGPLGVLGMALAWRTHPHARVLALCVPAYVATFVLFFVADRYRLPVVPLLLLFAGYAGCWLAERVRLRETAALRPALAGLAALALFCCVEWHRTATPATWAQDHWSAANRYREQGRLPEAESHYRKALALDARNADAWTNLGAVQFGTGQVAEAAESFRRSIELAPESSTGFYNLAMCELELGRREPARRLLEHAARIDPEHRAARVELARLGQ